jgi:hypothetical protein
MSYLHCPTCKCAYNIALSALCPNCPVPMTEVDPAADIVAAAERLAYAMARATPSERKAATTRMDQLALPAPDAKTMSGELATLRSIRDVIEPVALPPPPKPRPLLAVIAYAVIERISERAPRLVERVPMRLRSVVRRALAA